MNEHQQPKNSLMTRAMTRLKKSAHCMLGTTEEVMRSGNWHGNGTCWRMVLELARMLVYANGDGSLRCTPKRCFSAVDNIKAIESNGSLAGEPNPASLDSLAVDVVSAHLIGSNYRRPVMLSRGFDQEPYPFCSFSTDDIHVISHCQELQRRLADIVPASAERFKLPIG